MLRRWAPIHVVLLKDEIAEALSDGYDQTNESIARGRRQAHGYKGDPWIISERGALGQRAFCKGLGLPWKSTLGTFKGADWGSVIQIRTATCKAEFPPDNFGTLIIRPADPPHPADDLSHRYVLVTGRCPNFTIKGWIEGRDTQRPEWERGQGSRPVAHWVPWRALNKDMDALLKRRPLV